MADMIFTLSLFAFIFLWCPAIGWVFSSEDCHTSAKMYYVKVVAQGFAMHVIVAVIMIAMGYLFDFLIRGFWI